MTSVMLICGECQEHLTARMKWTPVNDAAVRTPSHCVFGLMPRSNKIPGRRALRAAACGLRRGLRIEHCCNVDYLQ